MKTYYSSRKVIHDENVYHDELSSINLRLPIYIMIYTLVVKARSLSNKILKWLVFRIQGITNIASSNK